MVAQVPGQVKCSGFLQEQKWFTSYLMHQAHWTVQLIGIQDGFNGHGIGMHKSVAGLGQRVKG